MLRIVRYGMASPASRDALWGSLGFGSEYASLFFARVSPNFRHDLGKYWLGYKSCEKTKKKRGDVIAPHVGRNANRQKQKKRRTVQ
jgi:hypothetical protein